MSKTNKPQIKIRCLLDAVDLPPSSFALPGDGRQRAHLCLKRKVLVTALARYANPDGTSCYPSVPTLKESTEMSKRTIYRLLGDLRSLGILSDGDLHPYYKTRVRSLNLPVPSSPDSTAAPVPSSAPRVPSSASTCAIFEGSPVPSSQAPVPRSADFEPLPPLVLPPFDTPPSAPSIQPAPAEPVRADGRREACSQEQQQNQEQEPTAEEYAEMEKSQNRFHWSELLKKIPEQMRGAVPTKEQREQVIKQLTGVRSLEPEFYIAAMEDWIDEREMPIEDRRFNRWGAWLEECEPFLEDQREEQHTERQRKRIKDARDNINFLYPNLRFVVPSTGDVDHNSWVVVRQCYPNTDDYRADIYPTKELARQKALLACRSNPHDCTGNHEIRSMHEINGEVLFRKYPDADEE